ncbi:MAG: acyl-CoA synthetase [Alphaproteobacteria bacterium]|nr:acyl-CoA synthetase [Alphaproteobacteria bacterium]
MCDPLIPLIGRAPHDVVFRRPGGSTTAAAFLADAQHLAAGLPDASHVVNLCQDRYCFAVAFAAALLRGQVSLLSSDRSTERLRGMAGAYPGLYALADEPGFEASLPVHPVAADASARPRFAPDNLSIRATQLAAIVFTSGSTGEPVAHRKLWGALAARSRDAGRRFRMSAGQPVSIVGTVPAQHMYGFETTVLLPLHAPASSWCGPAFFPRDVRAALEMLPERRVLVTTPLQIRALLQAESELPALDRVISATAPLYAELAAEAERRWQTEVHEIFGATEVGSIASRRTIASEVWTTYPRVRLHASRTRTGEEDVLVAGPFSELYPLSDLVERLDGTRFRLLGRRTDVVKLGGRRTSLAALNHILTSVEGVSDGIFVAPDDLDERPTARLLAFVVAPELSAEAVMAALRGRVDPVFLPRRVVRVDVLPRNPTGKLPEQALAVLRARVGEG